MLNKNPKTRLSMPVALKHAWFKMNFDMANRSAGDHEPGEVNTMIHFRHKKVARRGSGLKLTRGTSKKGGKNFMKFD